MDTRSRNVAPAHLTLRQLSYFVTVAEERHFRRAAERLHISQPPLTQSIQGLERDLGVQLFTRTSNHIELTEAGRLILAEAKATLAQAERLQTMALRMRQGEAGTFRVSLGCSASLIQSLREAIEAFRRDHPNVVLDQVQTTCRDALEELKQGKIDACVLRRAESEIDGIRQMVIARDRLMLVLPSNHPKAREPKVALGDVVAERFIQCSSEKSVNLHRQLTELWRRASLSPHDVQICESGLTILAMVAGGVGIAILPSTLNQVQMPNVVWKPIDVNEQWTTSAIVMLSRTDGQNDKIRSRFIDYVERFSSGPH
jgi:DNA-binding transcriptional LysR family regulator